MHAQTPLVERLAPEADALRSALDVLLGRLETLQDEAAMVHVTQVGLVELTIASWCPQQINRSGPNHLCGDHPLCAEDDDACACLTDEQGSSRFVDPESPRKTASFALDAELAVGAEHAENAEHEEDAEVSTQNVVDSGPVLVQCKDYRHSLRLCPVWLDLHTGSLVNTGQQSMEHTPTDFTKDLNTWSQSDVKVPFLHWLVLSPESATKITWDMVGLVVFLLDIFSSPMEVFFLDPTSEFDLRAAAILEILTWASAAYWTLTVPFTFMCGYHTADGTVESRLDNVAMHYLHSWFLHDILLVISDWIFIITMHIAKVSYVRVVGRSLRVLRLLTLLRVLKMQKILDRTTRRSQSSRKQILVHMVKWLFVMIALVHVIGCAWYSLGTSYKRSDHSWVLAAELAGRSFGYKYLTSVHWSLAQFTATKVSIRPTNTLERFFAVTTGAMAGIMNPWIVSRITTALVGLQALQQTEVAREEKLRRYLRKCNISLELRGRIWHTVRQHAFSDQLVQDNVELLLTIPVQVLAALRMEVYQPALTLVPFFRICALSCLDLDSAYELVMEVLGESHIAKGQRLFSRGEDAKQSYFLVRGGAVYSLGSKDTEVAKNDVLCEQALWLEWQHTGTATTVEDSDLITIGALEFRRVFSADAVSKQYAYCFLAALQQGQHSSEVIDRNTAQGIAKAAEASTRGRDSTGARSKNSAYRVLDDFRDCWIGRGSKASSGSHSQALGRRFTSKH